MHRDTFLYSFTPRKSTCGVHPRSKKALKLLNCYLFAATRAYCLEFVLGEPSFAEKLRAWVKTHAACSCATKRVECHEGVGRWITKKDACNRREVINKMRKLRTSTHREDLLPKNICNWHEARLCQGRFSLFPAFQLLKSSNKTFNYSISTREAEIESVQEENYSIPIWNMCAQGLQLPLLHISFSKTTPSSPHRKRRRKKVKHTMVDWYKEQRWWFLGLDKHRQEWCGLFHILGSMIAIWIFFVETYKHVLLGLMGGTQRFTTFKRMHIA